MSAAQTQNNPPAAAPLLQQRRNERAFIALPVGFLCSRLQRKSVKTDEGEAQAALVPVTPA